MLYVSPYITGLMIAQILIVITLFSQKMPECYRRSFFSETLNCAVPNSGFTKNVCGESWLTNYLDTLTESDRSKIVLDLVTQNH